MIGFAAVKAGRSLAALAALAALARSSASARSPACRAASRATTDRPATSPTPGTRSPTSLTPEQAKQIAREGRRRAPSRSATTPRRSSTWISSIASATSRRAPQGAARRDDHGASSSRKEATAKGYDKDPVAQQEIRAILRDAMLAEARKNAPTPARRPRVRGARVVRRRTVQNTRIPSDAASRVIVAARRGDRARRRSRPRRRAPTAAQWGELVRAKSLDPQARANVPVDLAGDVGIVAPPGDPRGENSRVPDEVRAAAFEIAEVGGVADKVVALAGQVLRRPPHAEDRRRTSAPTKRPSGRSA